MYLGYTYKVHFMACRLYLNEVVFNTFLKESASSLQWMVHLGDEEKNVVAGKEGTVGSEG